MPGDLHNHTTYSDGSVPVARLPLMAARVGLDAMAISDHDTLRSVQYAYDHPVQDGVKLIPATELTGYDYERQHRVHLLAYWPDPESEALRRHCDIMRQRRNECCFAERPGAGSHLPPVPHRAGAGIRAETAACSIKSGIMQALRELGLADSIYGERYHELFGWNPRGRVLHSPEYIPVREVLATARAAGAVVVFAHPTVYKSMPLLRELVSGGDGGRHRDATTPATAPRTRPSAPPSAGSITSSTPAAPTSTGPTTKRSTPWAPAPPPMTRSRGSRSWRGREKSKPI